MLSFPPFRNGKNKTEFFEKNKGEFSLKNGGAVLEQLITLHNGDCNPIRSYTFQELKNATGDFRSPIFTSMCRYNLYKGIHEDRDVSVKEFFSEDGIATLESIANDVAIASRMSNHKNVLKLLGCCLETELPLLVYEFPTEGNLSSYVEDNIQLPWKQKLRIVTEAANAVAYLHYGLSKMIIHRDITADNIFLGQNMTAKLFGFQDAIPIPEGKAHVDADFTEPSPPIAPETYIRHSDLEAGTEARYTEKSDVYGFGVLLCEVLIQKRIATFRWHTKLASSTVGSHEFWEEVVVECWKMYPQEENKTQVMEYVKLVQDCVKENPDERPDMIEVAKALRHINTI